MKIVRFLLPALLLAFAANPAHAQSQDKLDKARGTADKVRQADPPRAQSSRETAAGRAQRQRRAEEEAQAERFPPAPSSKPPSPPSSSSSSSSSGKGK